MEFGRVLKSYVRYSSLWFNPPVKEVTVGVAIIDPVTCKTNDLPFQITPESLGACKVNVLYPGTTESIKLMTLYLGLILEVFIVV